MQKYFQNLQLQLKTNVKKGNDAEPTTSLLKLLISDPHSAKFGAPLFASLQKMCYCSGLCCTTSWKVSFVAAPTWRSNLPAFLFRYSNTSSSPGRGGRGGRINRDCILGFVVLTFRVKLVRVWQVLSRCWSITKNIGVQYWVTSILQFLFDFKFSVYYIYIVTFLQKGHFLHQNSNYFYYKLFWLFIHFLLLFAT